MTDLTVPAAPALATIPAVELVQAGQWDLGTGRVTFTPGDLRAAVAALDCPAIRRPVLKLGHDEPTPEGGVRWDGEPAVGYIANMTTIDGGMTVVGDYAGMPAWLADIAASAYPDRSIEGVFGWRCQIGHTHPFVITAVALLGVTPPGVGTLTSLQDVAALYGVAATAPAEQVVTVRASRREDTMPNPRPAQVAAAVSSEDVRRAYYDNAPYSVWICEMQLDPLQLITMDDEDGGYARVPIVLDGDTITFGPAVPVRIEYVDQPAPTAEGTGTGASPVAASRIVFASRAESRREVRAAAVSDRPWGDYAPADYDITQWRRACLIDTGDGAEDSKARYKLPVREPDGTLSRGGVHAAAGGHGLSAVKGLSDDDRTKIAKQLVKFYTDELKEDPPQSLLDMAGMSDSSTTSASRAGEARSTARAASSAPNTPPAPGGSTHQEGAAMDAAKIREALGLQPEATDDEVRAVLALNGLTVPEGTLPDESSSDDTDTGGEPETDTSQAPTSAEPEAVAASGTRTAPPLPPGTVAIDEGTLAQLRRDAQEGVAARAQQRQESRDRHLDDAIAAGKFPPARRSHWEKYWREDEEGARQALASLAEGLVPVSDLGQPGTEPTSSSEAEFDFLFPPTTVKG